MSLDTCIEIIAALLFFLYIVWQDIKSRSKKIVPFHKSIFHSKKHHGKFILSCRDPYYCENDHTGDYIQACWDEIQKDKSNKT